MPISRDVARRAAAEPDRPALTAPSGRLTYGELHRLATARAKQLSAGGIRSTQPVAVVERDPARVLVQILAADLLGAFAVVADPQWPAPTRQAALDAAATAAAPYGATVALVVFTAGSTAVPKPVPRTRRSWTTSFPTFSALTGVGATDRVLIPGPLCSSLFLFGAVHALTMGATVHLLARWSARQAAAACHGPSGATAVHLVPAMLTELLDLLQPSRSRLRTAVCGGAHLQLDTRQAARARAGRLTVIDYYGATELSFVAMRRPGGDLRPFPGVQVVSERGLLWVRGPYLALGAARGPDGFATAGDHGEITATGAVVVRGRGSCAVSTGGATVHVESVEGALRQLPTVRDVAVVGTPHERLGQVVTAVVEPVADTAPTLAQLRAALRALPAAARPRRWHLVERLPRLPGGKVDRVRVARALADGSLPSRDPR